MAHMYMQKAKQFSKRTDVSTLDEAAEISESKTRGLRAKKEADDIIDAIDAVLEENAEEFVDAFIQKGGE